MISVLVRSGFFFYEEFKKDFYQWRLLGSFGENFAIFEARTLCFLLTHTMAVEHVQLWQNLINYVALTITSKLLVCSSPKINNGN